ncbi:undecaprenyldiphospho-muramoylpentapeptide beta-N-acetylglucosaminyltransferase [Gloeothece verrucosa]|uniref:UDP-N-acetylglucosamine--N-acetylmuramyl-(pentapeptide) pyrophosphoryl-undecaprenol N-acetylglucosamine transferase n=1 Tax=Gloeothece verrucosa (strain PCC 7822) TaxID=497965 RepID=E0U603_GLOV7|nr:undecaprenyldiphospho-muramoylpentapeptide beta-N-acetylglucosaminyltransferase [Gloeothece verrucosa]ADN17112.1 UDP-N-acetylglucosamine--N-acetylmuramyl-(pentapeptide) pyrophosphoryl-undecaprenol N-acetylglucosamine transferase [Gloeothece verrucosa PCC 7822]
MTQSQIRLLIAASGTGGHLFPALAVAQQLPDLKIEWLGVPNRLEQTLVPSDYPLHTIAVEGFQTRSVVGNLRILLRLIASVFQVKNLLKQRNIDLVFTTGGYIAGPAILAAHLQGVPVILHESNYLPGKVTRFFSRWCQTVALGFAGSSQYFPKAKTLWVSTPVRSQFLTPQALDLPIPDEAPLIVVVGGSQGAVAVNELVRQCALKWFEVGAYMVHLTGDRDQAADSLKHPQYFPLPFYENMAGLLQRANLAISRAGAGTLTELAVTHTPAILIPYPYAAEDHQTYNARVFADAGAAYLYRQEELTPQLLEKVVLDLLNSPEILPQMTEKTANLAVIDSAQRLAALVRQVAHKER